MGFLRSSLSEQEIGGVRQIALAIGALVFSGLNIVVLDLIHLNGAWQAIVALAVSTVTLAWLVGAVQKTFLRSWAHSILGKWAYKSSSGNYGLAEISFYRGELQYEVQLYRTEDDLNSAIKGEPGFAAKCFATCFSGAVAYKGRQVELIYKILHSEDTYPKRAGMLILKPLSDTEMKGYWTSDIQSTQPNRGTLDMYRPK
jgi:hypothetical protein